MSAPRTDIIISAVWTPSGGSAITITGVQEASIQNGGTRITWSGDGVATVQAQAMEDLEAMADISALGAFQFRVAGFRPGTTGSLVLTYAERAKGRGAVSGANKTATLSDAMVVAVEPPLPHRGTSITRVQFGAVNATGDDPVTWQA